MTIAAWQGNSGNSVPIPIPLGATTVNGVNPNNFSVYLTIAGGTVTNITVNAVSQGAVVAGTFTVNPGANVNLTYSAAPTTFRTVATGLTLVNSYPFTSPEFQAFTAQQYAGWTGSGENVAPIYT